MTTYGLWIDVEFCTGCHACEMSCRQEHGLEGDRWGIKVQEIFLNDGETFDYLPVPTNLCNLCLHRTVAGKDPACVQHCMAQVLAYGPLEELVKLMAARPRSAIFAPGK
jgi:Fe-S-cluster-containing dehydrogenase component